MDSPSVTARPLRVLVVDQGRGMWGAQRYLLGLAPLLRDRGVELTLAAPRTLELHQAWLDAGYQAVHLDIPIERSIRSAGRPAPIGVIREAFAGIRVARHIAALAADGGFDALWANAHWTHLEASVAGRWCRTPVVLHLHEEAIPGIGRWLRTAAVRTATCAVAVSQAVASGLPRGVARHIRVIVNGVDTQAMSPVSGEQVRRTRADLGIAEGELMVLAATRLDPSKRIEDLIGCVRALGDPRIRLVVAGSTSGYPDYEARMRTEGAALGNALQFCGNRDDMAALFGASDVVIHTGIVEGMPLSLIEAQACGTPVIAYDVAGVAEAVLDGTTGLLVPSCDVPRLTDALRRLMASTQLRATFAKAARTHALARHRIETQADRNFELLTEICSRKKTLVGK